MQPDCKNLGSGVPSLMAADKPCLQLQPSLLYVLFEAVQAFHIFCIANITKPRHIRIISSISKGLVLHEQNLQLF